MQEQRRFLRWLVWRGQKRRRNKSDKNRLKAEHRLRIEQLESRQLLSVSVPPVLTSSANPANYGSSVTFAAKMPTNATGNVTFKDGTSTLATESVTSPDGSAVLLGGTGGVTTNLTLASGSGFTMTISSWVQIDAWTAGSSVVASLDGTAGGFWPAVGYNSQHEWYVQVGNGDWNTGVMASKGGWNLITVVFSPSNIQFYYDGNAPVPNGYGSAGHWGDYGGANSTLTIGYDGYEGGSQFVTGAIDEVNVWNAALTSTEAGQLYNNGSGMQGYYPEAASLVAGWHFDEGAGTSAADFTGNGHTGTLFGDAGWTSSSVALAKVATCTTSSLSIGTHSITAVYISGEDDPYSGSTSPTLNQVINKDTTTTLSLDPSSLVADEGQAVTLTAAVSPDGGGAPTGVVEFLDAGTPLGFSPLDGDSASFTTAYLTPGSHSLSAVYEGDSNYDGSTSSNVAFNVLPEVTPLLTSTTSAAVEGQSLTISAAVPSTASGSVTFYANGSSLGAAELSNTGSSALLLDGADAGVSTNLSLSPYTYPEMTISQWPLHQPGSNWVRRRTDESR